MDYPKVKGGNFYLDPDTLEQVIVDGKPVLTVIGGSGGEGAAVLVREHNNNPDAHSAIELDCGDLG